MRITYKIMVFLGVVTVSIIPEQTKAKKIGIRWCPRSEQQILRALNKFICVNRKGSNGVEQYRRTLTIGRHFIKTEREANSFLRSLFKRETTREPSRTTLPEECCNETCQYEELGEYCHSTTPINTDVDYRYY